MKSEIELLKIRREIKRHGGEYIFSRRGVNDFGEPTEDIVTTNVKGLYHEDRGYISKTITEGAAIKSKPTPMLLCETALVREVKEKDELVINDNTYIVTGKNDLQNYGIVTNISMELRV